MRQLGRLLRRGNPRTSRRGCKDPGRPWGRSLPVRFTSGPKSAPLLPDGMRRGRGVKQNRPAGRLLRRGNPRMSHKGRGGTVRAQISRSPWDRGSRARGRRRPSRKYHRVLSTSSPGRRRTPTLARVPVRRRELELRISTANQRSRQAKRTSIRRKRVPQDRPNNQYDLRSTPRPQNPKKRPATVPPGRKLPKGKAASWDTPTIRAQRRARLQVRGAWGLKRPTVDHPYGRWPQTRPARARRQEQNHPRPGPRSPDSVPLTRVEESPPGLRGPHPHQNVRPLNLSVLQAPRGVGTPFRTCHLVGIGDRRECRRR